MRSDDIKIEMRGSISPPADMDKAARLSMTPAQYDAFIARHGNTFTPDDLVNYLTELRHDT